MKMPWPMKRVAFLYFSMVALAMLLLHLSVYQYTSYSLESRFADNHGERTIAAGQAALDRGQRPRDGVLWLGSPVEGLGDPPRVYFADATWPLQRTPWEEVPYDEALDDHADFNDQDSSQILMAGDFVFDGATRRGVVLIDNSVYELSEEQVEDEHVRLMLWSLLLLLSALAAIRALAARLSKPLRELVAEISGRGPDKLEPLPDDRSSLELHQLVQSLNDYQARIAALIARERAFSHYLSHELRTPLMVVQGATSLLAASQEPELVLRQQRRLQRACEEMREFTETLLGLSKSAREVAVEPWRPTREQVEQIAAGHAHLIEGRPVRWQLTRCEPPALRMPQGAFGILLGNLLKNAFAATREGEVCIAIDADSLRVTDSGRGLEQRDDGDAQGFGLGLLLVRDICHRQGWQFSLRERDGDDRGCVARVSFGAGPAPG